MNSKQILLLSVLKNIWLILAIGLVLFVISQAVFTGRELAYSLDFSRSQTRDIEGWYPESRTTFDTERGLAVNGEPIYMKIYVPVKFKKLMITGTILRDDHEINIGVKQNTGEWAYQPIDREDFILEFDLSGARIHRQRMEIILSAPQMTRPIILENNWKFKFVR